MKILNIQIGLQYIINELILKNNLIIARIKGGLGNQLFIYAAARSLAHRAGFELVLDHQTGFSRDYTYKRIYELNYFNISSRLATSNEMLYPFERVRRAIYKFISKFQNFENKIYLEENYVNYNLNNYLPTRTLILDGLWQNQYYFINISTLLKNDLTFNLSLPNQLNGLVHSIQTTNSVAIHVRWFDDSEKVESENNLNIKYYNSALKRINENIINPHYYVFSDNINATKKFIKFNDSIVTYASIETFNLHSVYDMYLMSLCKNFIISNSTFSWWSAWLCKEMNPIYLIPHNQIELNGAFKWNPIDDTWKKCIIL
jgi:hypothetical protein